MAIATLVAAVTALSFLGVAASAGQRQLSSSDAHWAALAAESEARAPPVSFPDNGTYFAGSLTDHAVLQKGLAKAAVYGVSFGATPTTKVSVTVAEQGQAPYTVAAEVYPSPGGHNNVTWKALLRPHAEQGGSATITAACTGCTNTTAAKIEDVTWGDVWFCFGQSNMWLPMHHTLTRNRTYAALDRPEPLYKNIRTIKREQMVSGGARWDGDELYVLPPPPPPAGGRPGPNGTTWIPAQSYYGWQIPNSTTVDEFSAACWYFAQELTDMAAVDNKPAPIIGLVQSAWGGSQIQVWLKNDTVANCKNSSGHPEQNRCRGQNCAMNGFANNGALWNGMTAPFINYTIFGALWYQGENNVYECLGAGTRPSHDGGPSACGNAVNATGYACQTKNLVTSYRSQFSSTPGTTDPMFPFGIVSLADGTSEGHGNNMANFRLAQTASYGILPGPKGSGMEKTFIAQAYDAGDPSATGSSGFEVGSTRAGAIDQPYQAYYDAPFPGREGYSGHGHQDFTQFYMGGIHPRPKQTVGRRLALAAKAIAYGEDETVYTGPVLKSCTVHPEGKRCVPDDTLNATSQQVSCGDGRGDVYRQITVHYREDLMGSDAVKLWGNKDSMLALATVTLYNCINTTCLSSCARNITCVDLCKVKKSTSNYDICKQGVAPVIGPSGNGYNGAQERMPDAGQGADTPLSPLEVQYNHTLWMPATINTGFGHQGSGTMLNRNCHESGECPGPRCRPACVNYTKMVGWSSMTADVPTALPLGCQRHCPYPPDPEHDCTNCTANLEITGLRYAWSEAPCCGGAADRGHIPCPVNSCPISLINSTLPAVPFTAKIVMENNSAESLGACECEAPNSCS